MQAREAHGAHAGRPARDCSGAPPSILRRLYGEKGAVVRLGDLLLSLSQHSREAAGLPTALVAPTDHADYAEVLAAAAAAVSLPRQLLTCPRSTASL